MGRPPGLVPGGPICLGLVLISIQKSGQSLVVRRSESHAIGSFHTGTDLETITCGKVAVTSRDRQNIAVRTSRKIRGISRSYIDVTSNVKCSGLVQSLVKGDFHLASIPSEAFGFQRGNSGDGEVVSISMPSSRLTTR